MKRIAQRLAFLAALIPAPVIGSTAPFMPSPMTGEMWSVGAGGLAPNVIFSPVEKGLAYRTPTRAVRNYADRCISHTNEQFVRLEGFL